jgi:polar amino acid transport system substrate-binding protein
MMMLCCIINPAVAEEKESGDLAAIRKAGEIKIGVKTDFAPFGSLNKQGEPIGLEVDLAERIAKELGVKLKLVGVTTENRFQRIEQNAVHLIIATAGDTRERRKQATAIEPSYYGAGVNVLLRPEIKAKDWSEIRGMNVCGLQSSYFNKAITQRFILNLQVYKNINDALRALKSGQCVGFLYSDVAIQNYLLNPEWAGYNYTLASSLVAPWSMFIAKDEQGTNYEMILGDIVAKLHREGYIIELEKKWNIRPSPYLTKTRDLWNGKDIDGRYICRRDKNENWPAVCRDAAFITSQDVRGLGSMSLILQENFGINISMLYDQYDKDRYLRGIFYTVLMIAVSIVGSVLIGYAGAKMVLSGSRFISKISSGINFYGMMTPPLVQMYLLYFGITSYIAATSGILIPPYLIAIFCLSFYHGAIINQTIVQSVGKIRLEHPDIALDRAGIPMILARSKIGINGAISNLTKASMIASAIAVPEILAATISIIEDQGNPHIMMILLLLFFYFLSNGFLYVVELIEDKIIKGAA